MDSHDIALIVVALCGAAGAGAIGAYMQGRATAEKVKQEGRAVDAKLPAEVANIAVDGATAAVLTMDKALKNAQAEISDLRGRVKELEAERAADRKEIEGLRTRLDSLHTKFRQVEAQLREARQEGEHLAAQLEALMKHQDKRK